MKKARNASIFVLALMVLVMAVNQLALPLPDWAVRTSGVVMLAALAAAAYCTVKGGMEK